MNEKAFSKVNISLWSLFLCLLVLGCEGGNKDQERVEKGVVPTVIQEVEAINSFTPVHVANLTKIAIAIEKYKQSNQSYPVSLRGKEAWDRLFFKNGDVNSEWLNSLVPKYIELNPAETNNPDHLQYVYMSDGAHYKLLVLKPNDCELVQSKKSDLIDPRRGCRAYGFWTVRAGRW